MPTIRGANGGHRAAGIALIHRHHAIVGRQLLNGIPRGSFPERRRRAHPSRRDEQDREPRTMLFIVQLDIVPFEDRHVYSSLSWSGPTNHTDHTFTSLIVVTTRMGDEYGASCNEIQVAQFIRSYPSHPIQAWTLT